VAAKAAKSAKKQAATTVVAAPPAPDPKPAGAFSALEVNLGHVFGLRSKSNTCFRQSHFVEARRALSEERFATVAEAARAVAEEAPSRTRGAATRPGQERRRQAEGLAQLSSEPAPET
jgi:hypothetical protein